MLSAVFLRAHAVCAVPLDLELSAVFLGASGFSSPSSLKPPRSSRTDPISPSPQPSPSSSFPHRRTTLNGPSIPPTHNLPPSSTHPPHKQDDAGRADRILSLSAFPAQRSSQPVRHEQLDHLVSRHHDRRQQRLKTRHPAPPNRPGRGRTHGRRADPRARSSDSAAGTRCFEKSIALNALTVSIQKTMLATASAIPLTPMSL